MVWSWEYWQPYCHFGDFNALLVNSESICGVCRWQESLLRDLFIDLSPELCIVNTKEAKGFVQKSCQARWIEGRKRLIFLVLKRGRTFCPLLLLFQKALQLFKARKAIAEYLCQLMTGTELGGQIWWWEGRGSLGTEENCHYWLSKVIRDTQLWAASVLLY